MEPSLVSPEILRRDPGLARPTAAQHQSPEFAASRQVPDLLDGDTEVPHDLGRGHEGFYGPDPLTCCQAVQSG